jgi:hypothetical protein
LGSFISVNSDPSEIRARLNQKHTTFNK